MELKDKLKELPKNPGCYLMKNINNEIIYVGKAKNLSNRVKSYFVGSHNAKTQRLVMDIVDFEYIITSSEKEAFILEINLIKKHLPKYNIMLTDDKTYPYIAITNEIHPRIIYTRDLSKKGKYFGPYPNVNAARQTFDMLNKIYPLRKCKTLPKRECLYYHINNCLAPCIKEVDKEIYAEITSKITSLLKGNVSSEIKDLKNKMNEASERQDYEKALEIHKIIIDLEDALEKQKMELTINDADVFNYACKDEYINIQVFHVREFKVIERTGYTFNLIKEPIEIFCDFIGQFYLIKNNPLPKEIIIPNLEGLEFLEDIANRLVLPKQGRRKELLDLVALNIEKELDNTILKAERSYDLTEGATIELAKILGLNRMRVIEAFDNSNISGESAVSAMVTYVDGIKSPKDYRKYKVKTVIGSDDVNTFKEVIARRYQKLSLDGLAFPDLIIIDGGKGQVNAVIKTLQELKIVIPVMGLMKDDNHRTNSIIYNDEVIPLNEGPEKQARRNLFRFLTSLQDEVHRYAISFHHNTHQKKMTSSKLDQIKGIGEIKKKQILRLLGEKEESEFEDSLRKLRLNEEQIREILKIYDRK